MNLLASIYPILILMLLGLKRKPWFYGFTNENPKLKAPSIRIALITLFSVHTLIAIWYSTNVYLKMLAKQG